MHATTLFVCWSLLSITSDISAYYLQKVFEVHTGACGVIISQMMLMLMQFRKHFQPPDGFSAYPYVHTEKTTNGGKIRNKMAKGVICGIIFLKVVTIDLLTTITQKRDLLTKIWNIHSRKTTTVYL